jgi:hypothetical protein
MAFRWRMRVGVAGMGALGLGLGLALPAAADPKGDPIDMQCEELGSLQIVLNGNGPMTPGHVVGSTRVGIPYELRVEGTFTPVGGEPQSFLDESARPAPRNQRLDFCTFHDEVTSPAGTLVVNGSVWVSYTP